MNTLKKIVDNYRDCRPTIRRVKQLKFSSFFYPGGSTENGKNGKFRKIQKAITNPKIIQGVLLK